MKDLLFEENLLDMLVEQQLKLGYLSEAVRLYYPLHSLNRFYASARNVDEMQIFLQETSRNWVDWLGETEISHMGDRFCILIPPRGSDYVHEQIQRAESIPESSSDTFLRKIHFLSKLIGLVKEHGTTLEMIHDLFRSYSDKVVIQKMNNGEFDELLYFEDGSPDSYRYCLVDEVVHVTYHRYTEADYEDFHF